MAPPRSSAEIHQTGQDLILRQLLKAVGLAWPQFDAHDILTTAPRLALAILALVRKYGTASAVHASDFYRQERIAAGVTGRFTTPTPTLPTITQVQPQIEWATHNLFGEVTPELEQAALTKVEGVAEKLVLDQSRDVIVETVKKDPKAKGWARVPEPGACSFCLMLATRGAVYKQSTVDFKTHDHCRCHAEPVFTAYEPSANVRRALAIYVEANSGKGGDKANNFRVALQQARDAGRFTG